jgi:hypothetical protein
LSKSVVFLKDMGRSAPTASYRGFRGEEQRNRQKNGQIRAGKLRPFDVADPSLEVLELGA